MIPKITELTPEQKRIMCHKACGKELYMIVKQGMYYRPDAAGYTGEPSLAWRLPLKQAKRYEMYADRDDVPNSEKVTLEEVSALPYDTSLDAMAEAEATLTDGEHFIFRHQLAEQCTSTETVRDYHRALQSRTPPQRLDAFLIAKGLAAL